MAIQLVPYNNAMRLGQGFNSYTQQICIDDAVVIDPARPENVVTNDGTTMRIMAEKNATPSVWNRVPEVVTDTRNTAALRRYELEQAVDEIGELQTESTPKDTKKIDAGAKEAKDTKQIDAVSRKAEDTKNVTDAADADNKGDDSTADEPPDAAEEPSAVGEMEKSEGSVDHITRDDLDEGVPEPAANEKAQKVAAASIKKETKPTEKASDDTGSPAKEISKRTPRNLATHKATGRSSSAGADTKTAEKSVKPTASQTTLQRAASKLKADAAQKKAEEKRQEDARKTEDEERRKREEKKIVEQRKYQEDIEKELRDEERNRRSEERTEQREIRAEKRKFDAQRREDARKAIEAAANLKATGLEDLKKIAAQNQFAERFTGMLENSQQYTFDASGSRGPSQTVTYTSRFVDRLSDVTEDMCISGSLSIKAAKIGGSGKGSFVDSDKFKESDLNFYISVKVVNQTVNFKDALVYNPVKSVDKDSFKQVFGDSFISGFVEGGEFNAIVSMKILNKAKKTDIQAEAKVALTAGPVNIEAQASVGIARSNLETNTETTIQVSWSGGGHIKPMEQQWDISSLMQAAARFPDLVADCPQRTYAILTKYDTLRSFVALKPEGCTPLQYENAQIYTNALLDSFMSYKSLYKTLGEQIFSIKGKTLEIVPWGTGTTITTNGTATTTITNKGTKDEESGLYPYVEDLTPFEASIKGLSDARTAIRRQMARIVNEVDLVEKAPKVATDEDHKEPFQSPVAFETRLPVVDVPERLKRRTNPLTGRAIKAKELSETEQKAEIEKDEELDSAAPLYNTGCQLSPGEQVAFGLIRDERPGIGASIRVTMPAGSDVQGKYFNNLDIIKSEWVVDSIKFHVYCGFISYVGVSYENGLIIGKGVKHNDAKSLSFGPFNPGERLISASIETGVRSSDQDKQPRVLAVGLFTNRGRSFLATAPTEPRTDKKYSKDGVLYENVEVAHVDGPIENGTFKGFFGRSDDDPQGEGAIWRLGLIWGRSSSPEATNTETKPLGLSSIASMVVDSHSPQSGMYQPADWKSDQANFVGRSEIKFNPAYSERPIMISGIERFDLGANLALHADVRHVAVTSDKATCVVRTIGSPMYGAGMSWLTIPKTDKHIETGVYEFVGDENSIGTPGTNWIGKNIVIPFSRPFRKAPTVWAWLCEASGTQYYHAPWASSPKSTAESTTIQIEKHATSGTSFTGMRVGWLAYDADECPNIQGGLIELNTGQQKAAGRVKFPREFKTTPAVFSVLRYLESGADKNLRIEAKTSGVKEDGFDYEYGSWSSDGDHQIKRFGYIWIAVV